MIKLAVTGADGFFASRFIEYYKNKYDIIPLYRNDLDIRDYERTIEKISQIKPTYLIHAAAISDTTFCEENLELSYDINVNGTINVARACQMAGVKMIFLSSDQVYNGNDESGPYNETILPIPNTAYGKQKLEAEEAVSKVLKDAVILRLIWL